MPGTTTYREALASIEGEAARLLPVFAAILRADEVAKLAAPVDCPVCATAEALTPARLDLSLRRTVSTRGIKTIDRDGIDAVVARLAAAGVRL